MTAWRRELTRYTTLESFQHWGVAGAGFKSSGLSVWSVCSRFCRFADNVLIAPGMRIRLTHNVDKDRAFVNGNTGVVCSAFRRDIVILCPLPFDLRPSSPLQPQGSRGPSRRLPAYVGVSCANRQDDTFLIGQLRRTDWLSKGPKDLVTPVT